MPWWKRLEQEQENLRASLITGQPDRPMARGWSLSATAWWGSPLLIRRCSSSIGMARASKGHLKAGNAHWSPDGIRILFQSFGAFPPDTTPQLYTISPDGTHLVQLTSKERNSWPAWSPDGTKISFAYRST